MSLKTKILQQSKNCITTKVIKEQFIERDLFNATDISQIKWRIYGQNFTKQDFHKYIDDNIDIIRKMYKDIPFPNVNGREIRTLDDFITNLKDDVIYTQIFK